MGQARSHRALGGRQSLVTPIDWKQTEENKWNSPIGSRRQSLVTPIDWKPLPGAGGLEPRRRVSRQSLVTPIDWKPAMVPLWFTGAFTSPILGDAY